jgi:hypothetical protein
LRVFSLLGKTDTALGQSEGVRRSARERAALAVEESEPAYAPPHQPVDSRPAAAALFQSLHPQERAAIVMKDVFDLLTPGRRRGRGLRCSDHGSTSRQDREGAADLGRVFRRYSNARARVRGMDSRRRTLQQRVTIADRGNDGRHVATIDARPEKAGNRRVVSGGHRG